MQSSRSLAVPLVLLVAFALLPLWLFRSAGNAIPKKLAVKPFGVYSRTEWTTSQVRGTPEPPPPLRTELAFPKLKRFANPVAISFAPESNLVFVAKHNGEVFAFPNDPNCEQPTLLLDCRKLLKKFPADSGIRQWEALYGLTPHPKFAENGYLYLCYVVRGDRGPQHPEGSRVARFTVTGNPPRIDPASEQTIITWLHGGHNGGCLAFGPDNCLYVSTGDGGFANPPDGLNSGQDVSNLLSSVLRIDVDHPDQDRSYSIPRDNPFVELAGARGEIWAYGMRNPWKMSFDRATGDLWVGDVGWELWELVYKVTKGGNYGWSVVEGRQPVHPDRKVGPTPILPPTLEIAHTDGVSITGGYVYRGKKFPELAGHYIFGDWETRRVWASKWDEETKSMTERRDLVDPSVRLVAFGEDHDGELYLVDYDDGTIHQFARNDRRAENQSFPRRLSDTGLLASVPDHQLAGGVYEFSVNAEQWADHASAQRFVAVPNNQTVTFIPKSTAITGSMFNTSIQYPKDTVLGKTLSLELEHGEPSSRRRIETQLLHFDGKFWRGYSYQWNDQQTDATLVETAGLDRVLNVTDAAAPGGKRQQAWHFPSRMECIRCHNQWAEYSLAFNVRQLNKRHDYGPVNDNQLRTLEHIGLVRFAGWENQPKEKPKFADPHDATSDINDRARAYLHVNCAHCHRTGGGGTAYIELQQELPLEGLKALDVRPTQGTFDIPDARILAAGDPFRSTLYYRVSKTGSGRMPHIGSEIVDARGIRLLHDWIRQLPLRTEFAELFKKLHGQDEPTALAAEAEGEEKRRESMAQRLANERRLKEHEANGNGEPPPKGKADITDIDRAEAAKQDAEQLGKKAEERATARRETIAQLLSDTSRAIFTAKSLDESELPAGVRQELIATATSHTDPRVRDLFEKHLPADKRVQRLGRVIQPQEILALTSDTAAGRKLFFDTPTIQCKSCHRVEAVGGKVGPELTKIGKKFNRSQILESILEPSKVIDPQFVSYLVATSGGKTLTGLLVGKNDREITLRDAKDQEVRIAADEVEQIVPLRQSLMPDLLLKEMTAQQVADLLAYLASLK